MRIDVRELHTTTRLDLTPRRVLIAGFTGRDHHAVQEHVRELAELGVPVPERTPAFYDVDVSLLSQDSSMTVAGAFTSGEVEPVVIVHDGARYLGVGSDHTDRDVERTSILASKRACPKVIGPDVLPLAAVTAWDDVEVTSWADGSPDPYQAGTLAQLLPLAAVEAELRGEGVELSDGDVLFLGTVPVRGALRAADSFAARLRDPHSGLAIDLSYTVDVKEP